MQTESQFREPTERERAFFDRLLEAEFPGIDQLASLFHAVKVRNIDEDGGLQLQSQIDGKAPVLKTVPVEAEARDEDGTPVHMLLQVTDGRPTELEFFREDGATVKTPPPASEFILIVLPPMPRPGWGDSKNPKLKD